MKKLLTILLLFTLCLPCEAARTTLLSAVVANTVGTSYETEKSYWKFTIQASNSPNAVVNLQCQEPDGTWVTFDTRTISSVGNTILTLNAPMRFVRATITSYSAGTFTVTVEAL